MATKADQDSGSIRPTAICLVAIVLWAALALLTIQAQGMPPSELLGLSFGVAFLAGLLVQAMRGRPTGLAFLAWDHATKHGRLALL